jgi:hypothetical protein
MQVQPQHKHLRGKVRVGVVGMAVVVGEGGGREYIMQLLSQFRGLTRVWLLSSRVEVPLRSVRISCPTGWR